MADEQFSTNILKSSGDDFFKLLEEHFNASIPVLIKKNLIFCDYNCAIVIAKLDDASITSIEEDIRKNFNAEMMEAGETIAEYLGRFVKCQEKFSFLSGQRKWLEMIVEACRRFVGEPVPSQAADTIGNAPTTAENGNFIHFIIF